MKILIKYFIFFYCVFSFGQLPKGFIYVKDIIPDLDVELHYNTSHNFVGKPIDGYLENTLILTKEAAEALKRVHEELQENNYCLKVYDGYRPQRAVNHFIRWAKDLNDTINKQRYYPDVKKEDLFKLGYISSRSGHSRGSTLDLTIINGNTGEPLDMGSDFDFFGEASWVDYEHISDEQKKNRMLLQNIMKKHEFLGYSKEWWHFSLRFEPFPSTYFDFVVE